MSNANDRDGTSIDRDEISIDRDGTSIDRDVGVGIPPGSSSMSHRRRIPPETHPTGDELHRVVGPTVGTGGTPTGKAENKDSTGWWAPLGAPQAGAPVGVPPGVRDPRGTGGTPIGCAHLFLSVFLFIFCQNSKQEHRWGSHRECGTHGAPVGLPPGARIYFFSFFFFFFCQNSKQKHRGHRWESHRVRHPGAAPTGCVQPRWGSHRVRRPGGDPTGCATPVGIPPDARPRWDSHRIGSGIALG
ncbi:hypothetical protein Taro_022042 [Colocasia esculenta]|uniref:Uncharacterized protein n=1 Tax=Colocasia esculenta TaxID=4460 RepID=A0A843V6R7_COLES|nr:hypothetical protein [Colocasia esculenta]